MVKQSPERPTASHRFFSRRCQAGCGLSPEIVYGQHDMSSMEHVVSRDDSTGSNRDCLAKCAWVATLPLTSVTAFPPSIYSRETGVLLEHDVVAFYRANTLSYRDIQKSVADGFSS
jgi:hypothetical protein